MSKILQDRITEKHKAPIFNPFLGVMEDRPPRATFKKTEDKATQEKNDLITELMATKKALSEAEEKLAASGASH